MNVVYNYSCSFSSEKLEPHDSTVFLFSIGVEKKGFVVASANIDCIDWWKDPQEWWLIMANFNSGGSS